MYTKSGGLGRHTCYGGSALCYAEPPLRDGKTAAGNEDDERNYCGVEGGNVVTNKDGFCECWGRVVLIKTRINAVVQYTQRML